LYNHALALGADYMSTGHYVRKGKSPDGRQLLLKGRDPAKDQSYVLHVMNQEKLEKALFPIGDFQKAEIRSLAESFGLAVARRPDSQDLCFLAGGDYREFLQRNAKEMLVPGIIVDGEGKVLGSHDGLPNYTIGQRKGLGLASQDPLYVLGKDAATNTLIVGRLDELGSTELIAVNVNWTSGNVPDQPFQAMVKTRYTAAPALALVAPNEDASQVSVKFESSQRDITPGQAAVFYDGEIVVGGGLIINSN
jgi:tRNA-specific 2-thiouridylase